MGRVLISWEASEDIVFYSISASLVALIELGVSIFVKMLHAFVFNGISANLVALIELGVSRLVEMLPCLMALQLFWCLTSNRACPVLYGCFGEAQF